MKTPAHSLRRAATGAALLMLTSGGAALATEPEDFAFDTTEDLFEVCSTPARAPEHVPAALACRAFIEATVQYHDEIVGREGVKRLVCYSKTTTIEESRRAFIDWGVKNRHNKKLKNELPVIGLMRALSEAYPCR